MKFTASLATALGLAATASAVAAPRPADILKARQFRPRQLLDVCAAVDANLVVDVLGLPTVVGLVDLCLCISALPVFIETNLVALAAVDLVGLAAVEAALTALINAAPGHKSCSYPHGATPLCEASNPCGFTCPAGTTAEPPPPADPTACVATGPSAAAQAKKRDANWWQDAACPTAQHSACGVPDSDAGFSVAPGASHAWECVDTQNDIESCGGCIIPLHPSAPRGTDCTELPGVDAVSCLAGGCAVHACLPGWSVAPSGDACVRAHRGAGTIESILHAVEYGLEHMPLKQ